MSYPGALMVVLIGLGLLGCSHYPYVNIPPESGDVAGHDADSGIVRAVLAEALRAVIVKQRFEGDVEIVLTGGASELTHADVARRLGDSAITPFEDDREAAVSVRAQQVRVRGHNAEVDVVYPAAGGVDQLVTVYLDWEPFHWKTDRIRTWRGAKDATLPVE